MMTLFRRLPALTSALGLLFVATHARADAPSGREILVRQEAARKIAAFTSKAILATAERGGELRSKTFVWWRKLASDGVHFETVTRFIAPASIRNEALLLRERSGENEILLYLPRFKKVRRVEAQSQSASFMGSVFSYSDIAVPHATDYQAKVLREEPCPVETRVRCYVLELTPATNKVKEATGYNRSVQWIRADNYVTVRGEFFNKDDVLWKKLDAREVREVDAKNHKWLAHYVKMENVLNGRVTVLKLGEVKVGVDIPDSTFTEAHLAAEE